MNFEERQLRYPHLDTGSENPLKKKKEQKVVRLKPHILDITMRVNK